LERSSKNAAHTGGLKAMHKLKRSWETPKSHAAFLLVAPKISIFSWVASSIVIGSPCNIACAAGQSIINKSINKSIK
jgi:hypothetical protein